MADLKALETARREDRPGTIENQNARWEVLRSIGEFLGGQTDNEWNDKGQYAAPGKFEHETVATFYFYYAMMAGDGETFYPHGTGSNGHTVFDVSKVERDVLGALLDNAGDQFPHFQIYEDDNGFVIGEWITAERKARIEQLSEEASDANNDE